jgi:hypothetical protein
MCQVIFALLALKEFNNKNHLKIANKLEPERELNQQ